MASSSLVSRGRWWLAVVLGTLAFALAVAGSFILPQVLFGLRLEGVGYAAVGVMQLGLALVLLTLALKLARLRWRDVGLVREGMAGSGGLLGMAVLAPLGAIAEELYFRGVLLLCLLRGRRLAAPIAAHAGWNLIAVAAMSLLY